MSGRARSRARDVFIALVESFLRRQENLVEEVFSLQCPKPKCAWPVDENVVRKRVLDGKADVKCQICGTEVPIIPRAFRKVSPHVEADVHAFRIEADKGAGVDRGFFEHLLSSVALQCEPQSIRIVHLSDLHITERTDIGEQVDELVADLVELGAKRLDYIVLSGDIIERGGCDKSASPEDLVRKWTHSYSMAADFVRHLSEACRVPKTHCIVVPGNHDIDRESLHLAGPFELFGSLFYEPVTGRSYPTDPKQRAAMLIQPSPKQKIRFLCLNSNEIGADANPDACAIDLIAMRAAARDPDRSGSRVPAPLGLAVCHHQVDERTMATLGPDLATAGFAVLFHGHLHELLMGHLSVRQREGARVIGCGAFSVEAAGRSGTGRAMYELAEVRRDYKTMRVWLRCRESNQARWVAFPWFSTDHPMIYVSTNLFNLWENFHSGYAVVEDPAVAPAEPKVVH